MSRTVTRRSNPIQPTTDAVYHWSIDIQAVASIQHNPGDGEGSDKRVNDLIKIRMVADSEGVRNRSPKVLHVQANARHAVNLGNRKGDQSGELVPKGARHGDGDCCATLS